MSLICFMFDDVVIGAPSSSRLKKVEMDADQFQVNGYSEIEREKMNLINSTSKTLEQLENYKNENNTF